MEKKFESKLVGATVERETEKAMLLQVEIEFQHKRSAKSLWFPKSQLKIDASGIFATAWIINEKKSQVTDEIARSRGENAARGFVGFITEYVKA
jgi:predicted transcriptional regulator